MLQELIEDEIIKNYGNLKYHAILDRLNEDFEESELSEFRLYGQKGTLIKNYMGNTILFFEKLDTFILFLTGVKNLFYKNVFPGPEDNVPQYQPISSYVSEIMVYGKSKIRVHSNKIWMSWNKEFLDVLSYVSNSSENLFNKYIFESDFKLPNEIKDSYIFALLSASKRKIKRVSSLFGFVSAKSKENFLKQVFLYIENTQSRTKDISQKEHTKMFDEIYRKSLNKLILYPGYRSLFPKLLSSRHILFKDDLIPYLFQTVKFSNIEWNDFFENEVYYSFISDFKQFILDSSKDIEVYKNKSKRSKIIYIQDEVLQKSFQSIYEYLDSIEIELTSFSKTLHKKEILTESKIYPFFHKEKKDNRNNHTVSLDELFL